MCILKKEILKEIRTKNTIHRNTSFLHSWYNVNHLRWECVTCSNRLQGPKRFCGQIYLTNTDKYECIHV